MPFAPKRCIESLENRQLLASVPVGFADTTVATGLASPTAMVVAPDGRIFVTQQGGSVRIIKNGALLRTPFATLRDVNSEEEHGLDSIELDPNFASNGFVYIYYTCTQGELHNRLARLTAHGDVMAAGSQVNLLDLPPLNGAIYHNGGSLHFGPDGKLYIGIGDHQADGSQLQSLEVPFGKMLRINPDGTIPTDGPWYAQADGITKAAYLMGLRNPFTFAFQPGTGRMFINDVGQETWEEIDEGRRGGNYGWPFSEGPDPNPDFDSPIYYYHHTTDGNNAITGGVFYNPTVVQFPQSFVGKYFFQDLGAGWLKVLDPAHGNTVSNFGTGHILPVDLDLAPDGSLYYLQRGDSLANGSVGRIVYLPATNNSEPIVVAQPLGKTVVAGDPVTFTVSATGTDLSFQWQLNDRNISGATQGTLRIDDVRADDEGDYRVRVSNSHGATFSQEATLALSGSHAPAPTILSPIVGQTFHAGEKIFFDGRAKDAEDGKLDRRAMTWEVDYITGTVVRPLMPPTSGLISGSFVVPNESPYKLPNVYLRIHLTAKDSDGNTRSVFRDIKPITARVKLSTNIPGVTFQLDGQPKAAPVSFVGVSGLKRTIEAPDTVTVNGQPYVFGRWSDGGERQHDILTPDVETVYGAVYVPAFAFSQQVALAPLIDSTVKSGEPTANFGSSGQLAVQLDPDSGRQDALLKFDISSLTSPIQSAKLRIFGQLESSDDMNVRIGVFDVPKARWGEGSISWAHQPTIGRKGISAVTVSDDVGRWYELDLTAYLNAQRAAGHGVVTLALRAITSSVTAALFNSREAGDNQPELRVLV